MLGLTRYQWLVLFAAWLGWGFDLFDSILFNFVAPNCVPTLLRLPIGSPQAQHATLYWTGILTSLLLIGWAAGGVLFGYIGDRIGRTRTMLITMLMYALGTAACAFAPNIWWLVRSEEHTSELQSLMRNSYAVFCLKKKKKPKKK